MNRMFTVGSLIPGRMSAVQQTIPKAILKPEVFTEKLILYQGINKFEVTPEKGILLDTALKQGKPIQYKCRKGTCGQCKVKVDAIGIKLSQPNEKELSKLKDEIGGGFRLACQTEIMS
ncbi:2Fe-2S iron-sulfur cluster-binding protein [Bacillus sp. JJ1764]|uniref:2Fe-2S iron-sulfur cluster-binding protein n=1 Tax=Bacillus sp. JJ1764 TaxID=3122964 RepID=UPI002FFE8931